MDDNQGTVVITGAAGGIGRVMASAFAENGYRILIHYFNSKKEAEELGAILRDRGFCAEFFRADVTRRGEVDGLMDYCAGRFGGIDVLINNAGISQTKLFTDLTEEDWEAVVNVNLKGVFYCSQSVLRYMLPRKKGKIINISSIWGQTGASCEAHYSAAKAGVIGLTKALAKELGPSNIQVNCIAPGIIETKMLDEYTPEELNALKEATPLMRLGKAEDVTACALFLASEQSDFITGQIISPNGGFVI